MKGASAIVAPSEQWGVLGMNLRIAHSML